jgi:hypothetical protein
MAHAGDRDALLADAHGPMAWRQPQWGQARDPRTRRREGNGNAGRAQLKAGGLELHHLEWDRERSPPQQVRASSGLASDQAALE